MFSRARATVFGRIAKLGYSFTFIVGFCSVAHLKAEPLQSTAVDSGRETLKEKRNRALEEFDQQIPPLLRRMVHRVQLNRSRHPVSETIAAQMEHGKRIDYFEMDAGTHSHIVLGYSKKSDSGVAFAIHNIDAHPILPVNTDPHDWIVPKVLHGMLEGARRYITKHPHTTYLRLEVSSFVNQKLKAAALRLSGFKEAVPQILFNKEIAKPRVIVEFHLSGCWRDIAGLKKSARVKRR